MRSRHNYVFTIILSFLITIQFLSFIAPSVRSVPKIYVVNQKTGNNQFLYNTTSMTVGSRFNVTIWVDAANNVASWQVSLVFNYTLLNGTRAWVPSTDPAYIFYGLPTLSMPPSLQPGNVKVGEITLPVTKISFTSPRKLAVIELKILMSAPPQGKVFSDLIIDNADTYLLDDTPDEIATTKTNGYYEYVNLEGGQPPPNATIISVVNPLTGNNQFIFNTSSKHVGDRFNATLQVNKATDVSSWQVRLTYNPAYLNATRAWVPSNDPAYVFYGLSTFTPPPSHQQGYISIGDITLPVTGVIFSIPKKLATIEFSIIEAPPQGMKVITYLSINNTDTYLLDSNSKEITTYRVNGYYEFGNFEGPPSETTVSVINPLTGTNLFAFDATSKHIGDKFNATAWAFAANNVASWQIGLIYNATFLNATLAWVPSSDPAYIFYGMNTFTPPPSLQRGYVRMGDLTLPSTGVSVSPSKKLAIIEFTILLAPLQGQTLSSELSINNADTYLLTPDGAEISTIKTDGIYNFMSGVQPVGAQVSVVPYQLTVGSPDATLPTPSFSLDIYVSNVVDLYAWQVKIYFDSSILNFVSATVPQGHVFEGRQFFAPPPVVEKDSYGLYVMAGATLMGTQTGYTGSGILCQLVFTGINPGNSPITFSRPLNDKTYLLDTKLDNIPFSATDGNVTVLGKSGPPKIPSNITLFAYPTTVIVGDSVNLNGAIIPSRPFRDLSILIRPVNGSWMLLNMVQTDYNSQYSYVWITQSWQVGWFELKASWNGDDITYGAESSIQLVKVEPRPQHDLAVGLRIPDYSLPETATILNATVYNIGLSSEKNVQFMILIDGVIVSSTTIPDLTTSYTLTYEWTPQSEASYNITAYAPPVAGETDLFNNKMWKFITVTKPLIKPLEGQWARYNISSYDPYRGVWITITWELNYTKYISPYQMNVTLTAQDPVTGQKSQGWMILNVITRRVEMDSGIYWTNYAYPGWIQTNITLGSTIDLLMDNATVTGSQVVKAAGHTIECWKLTLSTPFTYNSTLDYTFWYDKTTGLWITMEFEAPIEPKFKSSIILVATNIPVGPVLKIETGKSMYERGEIANLTVTYEYLDIPVADATVLIEVNYPNGTLWFSWTTTTDASGTASMSFLIPSGILNAAPYGTYTIYATAYKIGTQPAQGIATFMVVHYEPNVRIWLEGPDVALINQNATIIFHIANTGNGTAYDVTGDLFLPSDGDLQVFFLSDPFRGNIEPGKEVQLTAIVRASKPYRYLFRGRTTVPISSDYRRIDEVRKALVYAYHPDYPVDLLNMTVSVNLQEVTITFIVINYGDLPVEITLITSIQNTATKLMIGSVYLKITIPKGARITISITMTIPPDAPTGEYKVQGILATGLPHEGGFPLTYKEQTITL